MNDTIIKLFEAYLHGNIGAEDEKRLFDFIRNDPGLTEWIIKTAAAQSDLIDPDRSARMLCKIHAGIAAERDLEKRALRHKSLRKLARAAAIIALPVLSALIAIYMVNRSADKAATEGSVVVTGVERGQKARMILPDGSAVWLNSGSEISYTPYFNRRERIVNLRGEAYFEVAEDKSRPFRVVAGDVQVNVLGTRFNVKAYPEDRYILTTLISGSVEAVTPDGVFLQRPNQQLVYDRHSRRTVPPVDVDGSDYISWKDNILRFTGEPLGEIAGTIERLYNIDIRFADEDIKNIRLSGTIPNASLESVLEVISITSPVSYSFDGLVVVLSEDRRRKALFE